VRLRIATDCAIEAHPPRPDEMCSLGPGAVAKLRKGPRQSHLPGAFRASHTSMLNEYAQARTPLSGWASELASGGG
jgi:hypothetical protein